ncbi:KAP family P-loop NTPase fold protein [Methylobacterium tarhaniae]|uniref:KAP family P-loop NTPase fold protein n=1 Tax=Methylobacterium tarhaniae TaxID=1187852 RepID=UPI0009FB0F70|nr:P-loop NTPase fold protein [Methylobacterium tarhaniae]
MPNPQFSDDNPKSNPWTEDQLGFAPFAKRLASSIIEVEAPNGYVIGLQGAWGSGKSTALNFVQAVIKKHNDEAAEDQKQIHIIDFKPWIVSGHQDLIASFFKIMTEKLADQKDAWTKRGKAGLRTLRKNVDPLVDAAASVGSILAPGIGTLGGVGLKLASEAIKKSGSSKLDEWLAEPSLQSAYDKLRSRIVEQDEKFLVIIDDIDRLTQVEIRTIMQMVKTLGRLPNVVYLLAYDRGIVWTALEQERDKSKNAPHFVEKIIQQEVDLPRPKKNDLLRMLDVEIGFLTQDTPQDERWYHIVTDGIQKWIEYPRDVARLSNAVKFTWPAIEAEVDPQDVLAIEGLRLFNPIVFEWIRHNRDSFFGSNWGMMSEKRREKFGDEFLDKTTGSNQESIIQLLCTLIPAASKFFEHKRIFGLSSEPYYKVANRRGIGSESGYDTYFSLHQSAETISRRVLDKALTPSTDRASQVAIMQYFLAGAGDTNKPLIGEYFQDLRYRVLDSQDMPIPKTLFEAIFDLGSEILSANDDVGAFAISPRDNAFLLLAAICKNSKSSEISSVLDELFLSGSTLSFCAEFWGRRASENGLIGSDGRTDEPALDEPLIRKLHSTLVRRIEAGVHDGSIIIEPFFYYIAEAWAFDGNEQVVKDWISDTSLINGKFLAKICSGMLGYTVGSKPRKYTMHTRPRESYYDFSKLLTAANKHENDESLSVDERARIKAAQRGLSSIVAAQQRDLETQAQIQAQAAINAADTAEDETDG